MLSGGVDSSSPHIPGFKATYPIPSWKGLWSLTASDWALPLPGCLDSSLSAAPSSSRITQGLEITSHHRLIFINKTPGRAGVFICFADVITYLPPVAPPARWRGGCSCGLIGSQRHLCSMSCSKNPKALRSLLQITPQPRLLWLLGREAADSTPAAEELQCCIGASSCLK